MDWYDSHSNRGQQQKQGSRTQKRPYLSIYWKCCHVFSRIYKDKNQIKYEGFCPNCRAYLTVPIGSEGVSQRTFIAE